MPIVIDNRPGGGVIAPDIVSHAAPDGRTLLFTYQQHNTQASGNRKLPYHPIHSFTFVAQLSESANILVINPTRPIHNLQQFVVWTRDSGQTLNFGSAGVGSGGHLAGELFNLLHGIRAQHVAYRGSMLALTDLVANQYHYNFAGVMVVKPLADAGKLRALAVTSRERLSQWSELPSMRESIPGFVYTTWYGILAPSNLPRPVLDRLYKAVSDTLQTTEIRDRITQMGSQVRLKNPREFGQYVQQDLTQMQDLVRRMNLQFD
jgi:tripartite-type tricarboxylate transporter receptor subunit TctC